MARRRKDIEKRKRVAGEPEAQASAPAEVGRRSETFEPEDRFSEEAPPPRPAPSVEGQRGFAAKAAAGPALVAKNKEIMLLALLVLYVLLLGLGTVGELFEVGWILNLPLFR